MNEIINGLKIWENVFIYGIDTKKFLELEERETSEEKQDER